MKFSLVVGLAALTLSVVAVPKPAGKQPYQIKNEKLKNLPPLERRAALEKRILGERDSVRKLAAYFEVNFDKLPKEERERAGIELVDGLLDYRDVKSLKALLP